jgi:ribonuclease BN (tRNA processing enzyme)
MTRVRVQFLGTGDPFANGGRMQACILLDGEAGRVLLDCGATSLLAMNRFGVDPATIDAVVVTHFHGDHIGGLPFLLMEMEFNVRADLSRSPRPTPLAVAGPVGIEERVRTLAELFEYGSGFKAAQRRGLLTFVELEPGLPAEVGPVTATAYPARHTAEAIVLRIQYGDTTIAYSGDTGWTGSLLEAERDADLFICQAYTLDTPADSVLSYRALQEHRSELTCKRLLLTHLSGEMQRRLGEVTEEVAEDGMTVTVERG